MKLSTYKIPVFRVCLVRDGAVTLPSEYKADHSENAARVLRKYLAREDREHFVVLALNNENQIIGVHTASIGTMGSCQIGVREVFKFALLSNAAAVIVGHNHPSGNQVPSEDDIGATKALVRAGETMGIPIVDHIVLGASGHTSMFSESLL